MMGLRLSEIANIKASDVRGDFFVARVKGGKLREYPIDEDLRKAFSDWLIMIDGERLFKSASAVGNLFRKILLESKVIREDYAGPHLWRHSICTILYKSSHDLEKCRHAYGHKSIQTTMGYVHIDSEETGNSLKEIKGYLVKKGGD